MIKLTHRSWKIAKREFDRGNTLWSAKPKKGRQYKTAIEVIKNMKNHQKGKNMMEYTQWDEDSGYDKNVFPTAWEGWNFQDYDFFVLNKREARPYLKKIMVDVLINSK